MSSNNHGGDCIGVNGLDTYKSYIHFEHILMYISMTDSSILPWSLFDA